MKPFFPVQQKKSFLENLKEFIKAGYIFHDFIEIERNLRKQKPLELYNILQNEYFDSFQNEIYHLSIETLQNDSVDFMDNFRPLFKNKRVLLILMRFSIR